MDYSRFIRRRLTNIGVSHADATTVARWYIQQIGEQGEERAISYFKRIGDTILWYLYRSPSHPDWVATKHRFPKALYFMKKYDEAVLLRFAKFARAIRFDSLHKGQVEKVVKGVTGPYTGASDGRALLSLLIQKGISYTGLKPAPDQPNDPPPIGRVFRKVRSFSWNTNKAEPYVGVTMEPPVRESLDLVIRVPELYNLPYWMGAFAPLHPGYLEHAFETYTGAEGSLVGEIHAAQEGGGKLRMYAAPYSIVQNLLYPIHYWLDRHRDQLLTDCTKDQEKGISWAQSQLIAGNTVYSVDLSTATCRFPLEPQLDSVRSLGLDEVFVEAIKWASRGTWAVGDELLPEFPKTLQWVVGQPLGIAPSMSMFSLCHNLLLAGMCSELNLNPVDSFRVLGDDVVMVNTDLYRRYIDVMACAGVPISWNKCHSSSLIAEFAGATITRTCTLRPGQWREAVINNHIDLSVELKTPLHGEVSGQWLDVERLKLFSEGLYNPPISDWSRYIQLSTSLAPFMGPELDTCEVTGVTWETGYRRLCVKQFRDTHYPYFTAWDIDIPNDVFRGLPETYLLSNSKMLSRYFCSFNSQLNAIESSVVSAYDALYTSMVTGLLSLSEFNDSVKTLKGNTLGLLWKPPTAKKQNGASLHKQILSLLTS